MKKHLLTVLVQNKSGVLSRVSGLFARRGYNIESLVVCSTEDVNLSRMTIVAWADENVICQMTRQLNKLVDVVTLATLDEELCAVRELLMLKISASPTQRTEIDAACNIYKAEIIDLSPNSLIIELTGKSSKLDAFIALMSPYNIIELTRTGLNALHRGSQKLRG